MSLLDAITSAIANPSQQGSADQIGGILQTVASIANSQSVNSQGGAASSNDLMSAVGSVVREALQNHQSSAGTAGVENLVNQFAGGGASTAAVEAIFGDRLQPAIAAIAQRTGLDAAQIEALLPTLLPLVLQLLQSGAFNSGGNSVLSTFLDSDHDGDVDLGDVLSGAGRFLH